jgi:hypothetical protein
MNEYDDVMCQVRESFSGLRMEMPVAEVFARSRACRRRRLSGLTAAACATAGAAAAITLTSGGPAAPAISGSLPPPTHGPVELAAFSVTSGPGGSTKLILRKGAQYRLDPAALRQALARHGIPALVTVGTFCRPANGASVSLGQVLHQETLAHGSGAVVMNGRAMPSGTRLSIGLFPNAVKMLLIKDAAPLSCGSTSRHHSGVVHLVPSGTPTRPA